jgi:hypothetical protein
MRQRSSSCRLSGWRGKRRGLGFGRALMTIRFLIETP